MGSKRKRTGESRLTGGMLKELERTPGKHTEVIQDPRPWTPGQELAMYLAIASSESKASYERMMPSLIDAIGHDPQYASTAKPSLVEHTVRCLRNLEKQAVSEVLGNTPARGLRFANFPIRSKKELSWGERVRILKPWLNKRDKSRVSLLQLHSLLFRDSCVDADRVQDYCRQVLKLRFVREAEISSAGSPVNDHNREILRNYIGSYDQICSEAEALGGHPPYAHKMELVQEMYDLMQEGVKRGRKDE